MMTLVSVAYREVGKEVWALISLLLHNRTYLLTLALVSVAYREVGKEVWALINLLLHNRTYLLTLALPRT